MTQSPTVGWEGGGVNLTNRCYFAVCLFSCRSQVTSKCGNNKEGGKRAAGECVTDVLLLSITKQTHDEMESICFII